MNPALIIDTPNERPSLSLLGGECESQEVLLYSTVMTMNSNLRVSDGFMMDSVKMR